ncbi:cytochrome b561 domain-containing protein 2-like [Copidosoma floridanum]|uniref:cytochrome b561 domain-containing protein 2-like n=1 Tax=Copidosoma floridanum TaxID=29053 RepID=UPI0006C99A9D|nr:cytochrome b561 domain-containing protein 2-like [Copidosoma floridanum]
MKAIQIEEGTASADEPFVVSNRQVLLIGMNAVNHVLILGTVGFLCYEAREFRHSTDLHALLCTIGYVLLMAEAIVSLAGENAWTFRLTRRGSTHVHWILQVLGATCTVTGVLYKYLNKRSHFNSLHSILGIVSVGCITVVCVSGLPALFAAKLRRKIKPVTAKFAHNSLGVLCFVTGMAAQVLAYHRTKFLRTKYGDEVIYAVTVTTVLITLLSLVGATRQLSQQLRGVLRLARK